MRSKQMTYRGKLLKAEQDDEKHLGRVHALVSTWNVVDHDGDRMIRGAFADTLAKWREKEDPIPFIWSHQWHDWDAHVGWCPPELARETDRGLEVVALIDLNDAPAKKVYDLLARRSVTQFSFAYEIEEQDETEEDTEKGHLGKVVEIRKVDLYECGPTLLGSNSETQLLEVAARRLAGVKQEGSLEERVARLERAVQRLMDEIEQDAREPVVKLAEPDDAKGAIGYSASGTSDANWDGPATVASIPNDASAATLRAEYAWVDSNGDPAVKSSYKFPHHFYSGSVGAASTRACSAGIAVLNGGRGGANIPAGDRRGVYGHLAHHLRDADMEPPELAELDEAPDEKGLADVIELEAIAARP